MHESCRWEKTPAPEWVTIEDLDHNEISATVKSATLLGRMDSRLPSDTESVLKGLKLIEGGRILNAAVALYGVEEHFGATFPQFSIRLARFRGKDRLSDFVDNRAYWGNAFSLQRRGESFLLDHMPIAGQISSATLRREDYPMYPPLAFREALANAICHRDYIVPGGSVAVAMYDDHLEVINPGVLHFNMTPEKLTKPHESRPWNPLIASVFYRAGIIESWGTGTLNIIDRCRENKNPDPDWRERTESTVVTFYPSEALVQKEQRPKLRPKLRPKSTSDTVEEYIIKLLGEKGAMSSSEIVSELGHEQLSGGIKKAIKNLLVKNEIAYTIPNKPRSRMQKYIISE
jgi:ATP-dependent DNA helicase RecG